MKILCLHLIAIISWIAAGYARADSIDYVAYGDIRGYLEPCGCDPKSDLGGLKRLSAAISSKRLAVGNLYVFDLGNHGDKTDKKNGEKLPFIRSAVKIINPDAVLFNRLELDDWQQAVTTGLPFVLTNHIKAPKAVAMSYTTRGITVFGFVSPRANEKTLTGAEKTAVWIKKNFAKSPGKYVLLFSGTNQELQHFLQVPGLLIISDANQPRDYVPMGKERAEPGNLLRATTKDKDVYSVPGGGQGLLQFGKAAQSTTESLGGSICLGALCPSSKPLVPTTNIGAGQQIYWWLDNSVKDKGDLAEVFAAYGKQADKKFAEAEERRKTDLASSNFVGNAACAGCHAEEAKIWQASRHAHAITTLKNAGKERDPECVNCHVVGYTEKGGYVSESASPHLANVQCENCHGPRKDHVQSGGKTKVATDAAKVCTTCHHPPHSTAFDFAKYWPKIAHGPKKAP